MKIYLYTLLIFLTGPIAAQQYGYHYFTDAYQDQFNMSLKTSDGGVLNMGKAQPGSNNYFVAMKTDAGNNIVWYKLYENPNILFVLGATESNDHNYYSICNIENGGLMVLGIDSAGNEICNTLFSFPNEGQYVSDFFIAPSTQGATGFIMGGSYDDMSSAKVNFLASCNKAGNVVWSKSYAFTGGALSCVRLYAGLPDTTGYFCMGEFYGSGTHYTGAVKIDANGTVLWNKIYNSFTEASGKGGPPCRLRKTADGKYLFIHYPFYGLNGNEIYYLNDDGSVNNIFQWQNPPGADLYLADIVPVDNSSYIAVGSWEDTTRAKQLTFYFSAKGTNSGAVQWAQLMFSDSTRPPMADQYFSLVQMGADEYRAYGNAGYSVDIVADFNANGEGLCKIIPQTQLGTQSITATLTNSNVFSGSSLTVNTSAATFTQSQITVSYDSACNSAVTTGIAPMVLPVNGITVYPNPAAGSITVLDQKEEKIQFFDLLGRAIATVNASSLPVQVDISKFPSEFFVRSESGAVQKVIKHE